MKDDKTYDGEEEKNLQLQLEGRAPGPHNPDKPLTINEQEAMFKAQEEFEEQERQRAELEELLEKSRHRENDRGLTR